VTSVNVRELIPKNVLGSRETARTIASDIAQAVHESHGSFEIDLQGVLGFAPAFFSEILSMIGEASQEQSVPLVKLVIAHPPTELSSKHHAVCRPHGLVISRERARRLADYSDESSVTFRLLVGWMA
jgi:hypothetical protein|tara:strand:- start:6100 stop:6480 length:381 start_codon:yes stop_codon:yes gene_type:complete